MASTAELLAANETAILDTMKAQSYSAPGGRQKQMAALEVLWKIRCSLMDEINSTGSGNGSMASLCSMEAAR